MPSTKTFGMRQVGLTKENEEILKLWSDIQQKYIPDNPMFIINLENPDDPNSPTNIPNDLGASFKRTAHNWLHWDIGNKGQKVFLVEEIYTLDSDAKDLLNDFNIALVKMALEIGCSSNCDYDKISNAVLLNEPFALIKEILVRTLARALNVQGGVNANSSNVFKVFKEFIEKLATLSIAEESHMFGKPTPTKLNTTLSRELPNWINAVDNMIKWVAELNKTDNIIQSNLEKLETIQNIIHQHLYYNLMAATNKASDVGRDILLIDWVTAQFETLELDLLKQCSNVSEDQQLATLPQKSNVKSEKEVELICTHIKNNANAHIITHIKSLYSALRAIEQSSNIVKATERITKDTGCMAFLLDIIEANELSKFIEKCIKLSVVACKNAQLKDSPLVETLTKLDNCNVSYISGCNFKELAFPEFIENGRGRIAHNFIMLEKLCQVADCAGIFKWNPNLLMGSMKAIESSKFPAQAAKPQTKLLGSAEIQSKRFITYFNQEPIAFELSYQFKTKNSLLGALGRDRNDVINELLERIETGDDEIKSAVSYEASLYLQDKSLPQTLAKLLEATQVKIIEEPSIYLGVLCKKLRQEIKKASDNQHNLPINDNQFLSYLVKTHSPLLDTYKKDIATYQELKINKNNLLQTITLDLKFCLAYFNWYYIDQEGEFVYKPDGFFVLNKLVEFYKLPVIIWKQETTGSLIECERFNYDADKDNHLLVKHILYFNDNNAVADSSFQSLQVKESVFKVNKKPLLGIIARVLEEDETILSIKQKKSILNYFCVQDRTIAEENFSAKLEHIEKIKLELSDFLQQLDLHNTFKTKGLQSVLEHLHLETQEQLKSNPDALVEELLKKKLESDISVALQSYCYSGMKQSYLDAQQAQNKVGQPLVLQKNEKSYMLMESDNPGNSFLLFAQEKGLYFAATEGHHYTTFEETLVEGDGDCGFNAMGISRETFVSTLKTAISNQANREILSIEILEHLKIMYSTNSQLWDHVLLSQALKENFKKEYDLEEKIKELKLRLNELSNKNLTREEWLVIDENALEPTSKKELDELKKKVKELLECTKAIFAYCSSKDTCNKYIDKFKRPRDFWLGKYGAKVFVKEKNIALHMYDKSQRLNGCVSPVLSYDKETSYNPEKSVSTLFIVYEKGNHFNALQLINDETLCPTKQWARYVESLNQELIQVTMAYKPELNSTLAMYAEKVSQLSESFVSLALTLAGEQARLDAVTHALQEEDALRLMKSKRNRQFEDLDFEVLSYLDTAIDGYPLFDFQDFTIQIDTPLNKQNQTLLLKAVELENPELVQCLLDIGASVAVESDTHFEISINPKIKSEGLCNAYVLKLKDNQQWALNYLDYAGKKESLFINKIPGLKDVLPKGAEIPLETRYEIEKSLRQHHNLYKKTTPLLKAAQKIGFLEKDKNILFFTLLYYAVKEAEPKLNGIESFDYLQKLSQTLTSELVEHFKTYIEIQKERERSLFHQFLRSLSVILDVFGDQTQQRASQLAVLLTILIDRENSHEYLQLINEYSGIQESIENKRGTLFGGLESIVKKSRLDIQKEHKLFNAQIEAYRASRSMVSGCSIYGINDEESSLKIQALMCEMERKNKKLVLDKEKNDAEIESLKRQTKDIPILQKQMQEMLLVKQQVDNMSQANSTPSFFQSNSQVMDVKSKLRTSVIKLPEKYQSLFAEQGLEITQLSDVKNNFFTAVASEINRIKKFQGEKEVTESGLRQYLYEYYNKTSNCKKKITGLNQAFKLINEGDFQEARLEHYDWIKQSKVTDSNASIIDGVCAVEGVLLCIEYRLPAIYEIQMDEDEQIHYACVTDKGYKNYNADNEIFALLEINTRVDNSPVLFICNGDYYFVSKVAIPRPAVEITDDEYTEGLSEKVQFDEYVHHGMF